MPRCPRGPALSVRIGLCSCSPWRGQACVFLRRVAGACVARTFPPRTHLTCCTNWLASCTRSLGRSSNGSFDNSVIRCSHVPQHWSHSCALRSSSEGKGQAASWPWDAWVLSVLVHHRYGPDLAISTTADLVSDLCRRYSVCRRYTLFG